MNTKQITMKQVIENDFSPILMGLFHNIKENGMNLTVDGIAAYNPQAQFVGGMVINSACYTALELIKCDSELKNLGSMIHMVSGMEMRTWGILNSLRGLYRLSQHNLLHSVIDEETYHFLQHTLDWRTFVDEENNYALINKPTNYYGVAFGIARYRELLAWEPEGHSIQLLNRFLVHIQQFSGELGYMDETPGEGRFDRYTIVTPGEITALLLATGMEVPDKIREMLRKSCKIALQLANEGGNGFPYGRSSGAYGDTGILEVFSAAAKLGGILTEDELEVAYAYSIKIMQKIAKFWYDQETKAVNLWDKGRKTDHYRNKNRILSETISICMHVIDSYEQWKCAGFEERMACDNYMEMLNNLSPYTYVSFSDDLYKRSLAIIRDGKQIWTLPFVSGGKQYYHKDAYLPIPFQTNVIEYVPECSHGQLTPQLIMENGDIYMPLAYTTHITPSIEKNKMTLTCEYDGLCKMACVAPEKVNKGKAIVTYTFKKNQIRREDRWILNLESNIKEIRMAFLTYSDEVKLSANKVSFGNGIIQSIQANGFEICSIMKALDDGNYDTSHGRLKHKIVWCNDKLDTSSELCFDWTITY